MRRYSSLTSLDLLRLRSPAVERAQRRQPAHDVKEVVRQQSKCLPALSRALLRVAADEPHEHRHERQREQHDAGRDEVDGSDDDEDRHRNDDGEHDLRHVLREGRLERVDAGDRRSGHLGALDTIECRWAAPQPCRHEVEPQLRDDACCCPAAGHLEAPCRQRPGADDGDEKRERPRHVLE